MMKLLYIPLAFLLPRRQEDTAATGERDALPSSCGWATSDTATYKKYFEHSFVILLTHDQETAVKHNILRRLCLNKKETNKQTACGMCHETVHENIFEYLKSRGHSNTRF